MKKQLKDLLTYRNAQRAVVGVGVAATCLSANAAIDTAAITDAISAVATAGGVVGAAILIMHYGLKAYKWLRGAG